jgi:hypothetical protein
MFFFSDRQLPVTDFYDRRGILRRESTPVVRASRFFQDVSGLIIA